MDLKGMNRYQHFGLRRPWLEHFFEHKENCFTMGSLGTRQYDSLRVWLKEAGLLTATGNATCKDDIPADEFIKYCLEPAKEMRGVIKRQLCIIDPKEFNVPGKKDIPDIQYNYL